MLRRHPGSRGAGELRTRPRPARRTANLKCRVRAERTSWPRANLAEVFTSLSGLGGGLSRSVKQFASDCAEKGSISLGRFGCCHGQDQARGPSYDRQLYQPRLWPGLRMQRGWGPTVRHAALTAATGPKQHTAGHSYWPCTRVAWSIPRKNDYHEDEGLGLFGLRGEVASWGMPLTPRYSTASAVARYAATEGRAARAAQALLVPVADAAAAAAAQASGPKQ